MKNESPVRRPRVPLGPQVAVVLLAFSVLLAAVWWRGLLGAVVVLVATISGSIALVPGLRRRENWIFHLLFIALAICLLIVLTRHRG